MGHTRTSSSLLEHSIRYTTRSGTGSRWDPYPPFKIYLENKKGFGLCRARLLHPPGGYFPAGGLVGGEGLSFEGSVGRLGDRDRVQDLPVRVHDMFVVQGRRIWDRVPPVRPAGVAVDPAPGRLGRAVRDGAVTVAARHTTVALHDEHGAARVSVILLAHDVVLHRPRRLVVVDVTRVEDVHPVLDQQRLHSTRRLIHPVPQGPAPRGGALAPAESLILEGLTVLREEHLRRGITVLLYGHVVDLVVRCDNDPRHLLPVLVCGLEVSLQPLLLLGVEVHEVDPRDVEEPDVGARVPRGVAGNNTVGGGPVKGPEGEVLTQRRGRGGVHVERRLPDLLTEGNLLVVLVTTLAPVRLFVVTDDGQPRAALEDGLEDVHVSIPPPVVSHTNVVRVISHVHDRVDPARLAVSLHVPHVVVPRVAHVAV
eukprot:Hpha_TRINITY_DN16663_c1_g2::TRINITY_DN16663_c1_g2_i1::g.181627::m.181627